MQNVTRAVFAGGFWKLVSRLGLGRLVGWSHHHSMRQCRNVSAWVGGKSRPERMVHPSGQPCAFSLQTTLSFLDGNIDGRPVFSHFYNSAR